ncbi:OsmC family protein [Panacibacter ginsenosidivorans]|uniref:OsmC family protein n=1 Tax=Panacibacter ginsenosidivorans TaxID=1813871 RepID=A0A5B8VEY5_9BACT|nr:OsmC family protein [Panacibacter ginsenosidivorans]QEC69571.1 OsmC family protein [Panacibacter ginsenosidivorans]
MNAYELKALQTPLKEKYRNNPVAALVTLKAEGKLGENISCKVETGRAIASAGLHPATGGDGLHLCSGDMLLEALVACAGVTLKAVATSMGIEIKSGTVKAEGDIDFSGTLGVSKEVPVGFKMIRLYFLLETGASKETLEKLLQLTERYCVVYQTITKGTAINTSIEN